jgi:hypothetical protein
VAARAAQGKFFNFSELFAPPNRGEFDRISPRRHICFVIIESIERELSSEMELACRTVPPLDSFVFQQFCLLLKAAGKFDIARFREQEGMLFIRGAAWTTQLRDTIDSFLNNAETAAGPARQVLAEKTRLERHRKDRAIEVAAKAFGVPVK